MWLRVGDGKAHRNLRRASRQDDKARVQREQAAALQKEQRHQSKIAVLLLNKAQAVRRIVHRHDRPIRVLRTQIDTRAEKPARHSHAHLALRQIAHAAAYDIGKRLTDKGRRKTHILHGRQVVVDTEEEIRLPLPQHLQRLLIIRSAHELKGKADRLAHRLQHIRIDAVRHPFLYMLAKKRRMAADIDDAQGRLLLPVVIFLRRKAHELALRPVEKQLAQMRLKARVDRLRAVNGLAEIPQKPCALVRRHETCGKECQAQQHFLLLPLVAYGVDDRIDLPTSQRLVHLLRALIRLRLDLDSLVAHKRLQRCRMGSGRQNADAHPLKRSRLILHNIPVAAHIEGKHGERRLASAVDKALSVMDCLLREIEIDLPCLQHLAGRPLFHRHIFVLPAGTACNFVEIRLRIGEEKPLRRIIRKGREIRAADAQHRRRPHSKKSPSRHEGHQKDELQNHDEPQYPIHFPTPLLLHAYCSQPRAFTASCRPPWSNRPKNDIFLTISITDFPLRSTDKMKSVQSACQGSPFFMKPQEIKPEGQTDRAPFCKA